MWVCIGESVQRGLVYMLDRAEDGSRYPNQKSTAIQGNCKGTGETRVDIDKRQGTLTSESNRSRMQDGDSTTEGCWLASLGWR